MKLIVFWFSIFLNHSLYSAPLINLNVGLHDWPPYIISNSEDYRGIMVEVFEAITKDLHYQVKIHHHSTQRGLRILTTGEIDATPRAMEWVDHPENYQWSDPVVDSQDVIILRQDTKVRSLEQLHQKVLCTVIGYTYPQLNPLFANKTLVRADARDTEAMLSTLQRQHCDGAVTNIHVFNWHRKTRPEMTKDLVASSIVVGTAPYRFQFNQDKKWTDFIKRFNQRLKEMKARGELDKIINRYQ